MTGTRAAALAQELRERIALADTGPGGALESEAVLGGRYGVSRVTVRRALEQSLNAATVWMSSCGG